MKFNTTAFKDPLQRPETLGIHPNTAILQLETSLNNLPGISHSPSHNCTCLLKHDDVKVPYITNHIT